MTRRSKVNGEPFTSYKIRDDEWEHFFKTKEEAEFYVAGLNLPRPDLSATFPMQKDQFFTVIVKSWPLD